MRSRYGSSSSEEDQSSVAQPSGAISDQDQPQHDPYPPYYREVALSVIPSQYAEEVDTFRRILSLPDPRESMPRSSTSVMGLDDEKGRQELRPRGPSSMLQLSSVIKDAFDKFKHDFQAIKSPSTAKWYKVGQPCYEEKIQELNTDFAKICITPKPPGAPMGQVPLPILKELEHQAGQNISTLNFTAAFAKTSSSCNATLEKCQYSLKSTFQKVKSQIQKGANLERAAKHGYEQACEYLDIWNKTVLIQHRALTCLSKSLAHILQRELYTMGNTGLLRREAEITLLQPHLGETRCQELRNSPFWHSSLFKSQLMKEGEDFLLKKAPLKTLRVSDPIKTVPQLCVPQQSTTSQPPRLVSTSGQLQEQGFSVEVAERIAAPQRSSTRTIYKSKWALFEKWCRENSVDFSTPSVKQVSDFFMYLYQDLNRRPSTIDGYRTAIVDTLGPAGHYISQSSDLHRLLSSFHRDPPKSSRNLPKWNPFVVLNELTKAPFQPMKDTDLKHLTLKTAFTVSS